ncbi:unnamed protein product, partial [Laminaria digitata]
MQQPTWVRNATGNIATPAVTSWPYLGGSGVLYYYLCARTAKNNRTRGRTLQGKRKEGNNVTRTKPYTTEKWETHEAEEMLHERNRKTSPEQTPGEEDEDNSASFIFIKLKNVSCEIGICPKLIFA